ncbi:hypothetical protein [Phaeospirillum tilakii]|uniref:Virus attachment protein p12 family protein n=1 Tax=Phaeospirillum tilakii TaxID=741673 RepID=A0ABW5CAB5_9PROT
MLQTLLAGAVVAAAGLWLGWRVLARGRRRACPGCGRCGGK